VLAQQFVRYVAEETVKLSRGESAAADHEVMSEAERQSIEAQQRLDRAQQAWILDAAHESGGALPAQIDGEVELAAKVAQSLSDARSDIAEYQEKAGYAAALPGLRARASELDRRLQEIEKSIERKSTIASQRAASQEKLEVELKMAQTASEAGAARLRELRATAGTRGERLRIIDPGIVPQRPTSPNVALNVFAALVLTLAGLAAYLTVAFSYHRRGR
jgi:capsule polysaccharide export protein KpsE/RkpR